MRLQHRRSLQEIWYNSHQFQLKCFTIGAKRHKESVIHKSRICAAAQSEGAGGTEAELLPKEGAEGIVLFPVPNDGAEGMEVLLEASIVVLVIPTSALATVGPAYTSLRPVPAALIVTMGLQGSTKEREQMGD